MSETTGLGNLTHVVNALQELVRASYLTQQTLSARLPSPLSTAGITAARPAGAGLGASYFDTTLGVPIWWNGTIWVNSAGGAI